MLTTNLAMNPPSDHVRRRLRITGALLLVVMAGAGIGVLALGWRVDTLRDESASLQLQLEDERMAIERQRQRLQGEIATLEERRILLKVENESLTESNRQLKAANPAVAAAVEAKAETGARLNPRVYIQVANEADVPLATRLAGQLRSAGFVVPAMETVKAGPRQPEVRYFRNDDAKQAARVLEIIKPDVPNARAVFVSGFETSTRIRPGHLELWF